MTEADARGTQASVIEIFKSRQGEGICVGDEMVFVRFGGCNLVCDYCDTPASIPLKSGSLMKAQDVVNRIQALDGGKPGSIVSLTGGEPLLQLEFLLRIVPVLRQSGRRIYLETNGTLPKALEALVSDCDWVAMDFKPASSTGRDLWEAHRWFLETAGVKGFVKMVLTDQTQELEVRRAVDLIAGARHLVPLVLQPATPWGTALSVPMERLLCWWRLATSRLTDVRILPQIHRLWDLP